MLTGNSLKLFSRLSRDYIGKPMDKYVQANFLSVDWPDTYFERYKFQYMSNDKGVLKGVLYPISSKGLMPFIMI